MAPGKKAWHFPKRANLTEFKDTLKVLSRDEFRDRAWNRSKEERLASLLDQEDITEDIYGRISPSSVRTLNAAIKYFGFLKKEDNYLKITGAGRKLRDSEDINSVFENQFLKLQLTNPNVNQYCMDSSVFPFRLIVRCLLDLDYVSFNELGYFLVRYRGEKDERTEDELKQEIRDFRSKDEEEKQEIIEDYRETRIGKWALEKAPMTNYIMNFCDRTTICERSKSDGEKRLTLVKSKEEVKETLEEYECEPYNFESREVYNLYLGTPELKKTPVDKEIQVLTEDGEVPAESAIKMEREFGDVTKIIDEEGKTTISLFPERNYEYSVFDRDANKVSEGEFDPSDSRITVSDGRRKKDHDLEGLLELVEELTSGSDYDPELDTKLSLLRKIDNYRVGSKKQVRGGRLEQLFYLVFDRLREEGLVDEVTWNGKVDEHGVPKPAPGSGGFDGMGIPDLRVRIGDHEFVLEVTHISAERSQWKKEGASVPDHVIGVTRQKEDLEVIGQFIAPGIPEGNRQKMEKLVEVEDAELRFREVESFVNQLPDIETRDQMIEFLRSSSAR